MVIYPCITKPYDSSINLNNLICHLPCIVLQTHTIPQLTIYHVPCITNLTIPQLTLII